VSSPYRKPNAHRRGGRDIRHELARPDRTKAPAAPKGIEWPAPIRRWWRTIWLHPVAVEWDEVADFQAVARLAGLYADQAEGLPMTAAMLAQVARLESELGLTPAARRRQYTRLPDRAKPEAAEPGDDTVIPLGRPRRVRAFDPALVDGVPATDPRLMLGKD
jgi:hypothetical protein